MTSSARMHVLADGHVDKRGVTDGIYVYMIIS